MSAFFFPRWLRKQTHGSGPCIDVGHYKNCVLETKKGDGDLTVKDIISFRTKELSNYTIKQSKLALSNTDDKRVWQGLNSYAYGHYKLTD